MAESQNYLHVFVSVVILFSCFQCCSSKDEDLVESWAAKMGEELWELGLSVSQAADIKAHYKKLNARVLPTDGEAILKAMVTRVNRMLKQKMDAVMCVIEAAEEVAEEFEYNETETFKFHSAKCSPTIDLDNLVMNDPNCVERTNDSNELYPYNEMTLSRDRHFYGIPVNTNHSAVHVPTDIYDQADIIKAALQWSEMLNNVFVQNYMSDPTLSWQYFGSITGFLRHYPALQWKVENEIDLYDCRKSPWYIEAATCTKDIVILVDNSGSMAGMRHTIAKLAVNQILSTFNNNDFINILAFSNVTQEIVPCFHKGMLVQATAENVETFRAALKQVKPEAKANFTEALVSGFTLLKQYRQTKKCPDRICNQAIMLITDSVADNMTEVFQAYNWFENRTHIPVRVFTYLIGREVTKVREIQWMACLNRGYYVHIESLDEVRDKVLKYIPVIARPLVLQAVEHPLSWSHVFADVSDPKIASWLTDVMQFQEQRERVVNHVRSKINYFSQRKEDNKYVQNNNQKEEEVEEDTYKEYRLMTSVSGPAYDRKINRNNETRSADLLGVAGTDVPIRDIERLTLPYKIGANGYAFVITNNGYLLMHPDHRPVHQSKLRVNYASVDLTEVELLDDEKTTPREPSEAILTLRENMVNHKEGSMLNLKIKFHYDDMKRVGAEIRHYYYAPLNNTPFSIGLVLPHSYGNYWIKAGDEIRKSAQLGIPLTNYFKGNWRLHPDWVYCDYHRSSTGPLFSSREEKLLHFLKYMSSPGWQWKEQFPPYYGEDYTEGNVTYKCNRREIKDNDYYCDKELMQLLVFDAKSTEASYRSSEWTPKTRREKELVEKYGVSLRFVATQSGLTRWQHIPELPPGELQFGDINNQALGEAWYRAAVLQHHLDPEAFVFSVPFDSGWMENITVTASHAIFPRDGGQEAPASVVGLYLQHSALFNHFITVTSKSNCQGCDESCTSDALDCYLIDGNGYIVISELRNDTGRFFGEIQGAVMEAMVHKNIFRKILLFDYQAICFREEYRVNSADFLLTPFTHLQMLVHWLISHLVWILVETNIWNWVSASIFDTEEDYDSDEEGDFDDLDTTTKGTIDTPPAYKRIITPESCDRHGELYLLQHLSKEGYHSATPVNCSRPFIVKRIPHTNLLLIVVKALHQSCYRKLDSDFKEIQYNSTYPSLSCQKLNLNILPRRRLAGCFNEHPQELEIETCGQATRIDSKLAFWIVCFWSILKYLYKV